MSDLVVGLISGFLLGLSFIVPAYFYGRIEGIKRATEMLKDVANSLGVKS